MRATNNNQPNTPGLNTVVNNQVSNQQIEFNYSYFEQFGTYYIKTDQVNRLGKIYPVVEFGKTLTTGKNKGFNKKIDRYFYYTIAEANKAIQLHKERINRIEVNTASDKAKKAELKANFVNPFKVGDIFYTSWGYEQTNVDFYQVIESKGKFVTIKEISGEMIEYNRGDQGRIKPIKDSFTDEEPLRKLVKFFGSDLSDTGKYCLNIASYANAYLYTKGDQGQYCSWGY